jgi:hypothetical protein
LGIVNQEKFDPITLLIPIFVILIGKPQALYGIMVILEKLTLGKLFNVFTDINVIKLTNTD